MSHDTLYLTGPIGKYKIGDTLTDDKGNIYQVTYADGPFPDEDEIYTGEIREKTPEELLPAISPSEK